MRRRRGLQVIVGFVLLLLLMGGAMLYLAERPALQAYRDPEPGEWVRFSARIAPVDEQQVGIWPVDAATTSRPLGTARLSQDLASLSATVSVQEDLTARSVDGTIELVDAHRQTLFYMAIILAVTCIVLIYEGAKNLGELEGERIILESDSKFRQVVEYGVVASALGGSFLLDALLRRSGVNMQWRFGLGTVLFLAMPSMLLSYYFLVSRICARIGMGTRKDRAHG